MHTACRPRQALSAIRSCKVGIRKLSHRLIGCSLISWDQQKSIRLKLRYVTRTASLRVAWFRTSVFSNCKYVVNIQHVASGAVNSTSSSKFKSRFGVSWLKVRTSRLQRLRDTTTSNDVHTDKRIFSLFITTLCDAKAESTYLPCVLTHVHYGKTLRQELTGPSNISHEASLNAKRYSSGCLSLLCQGTAA